ncbi:hypothetical protein GGH91_003184, partial [Coemansia sp. RSA 2671]
QWLYSFLTAIRATTESNTKADAQSEASIVAISDTALVNGIGKGGRDESEQSKGVELHDSE